MSTPPPKSESERAARHVRRIPRQSAFYERLIPVAMMLLGAVLLIVIVFSILVLLGFVPIK